MQYDRSYTNLQVKRSFLRKWIRRLYLNNLLKYINGPTIDFGCGVGELLRILPKGSIGLDLNACSISLCKEAGLNASEYDPSTDKYKFQRLQKGAYGTLVTSHVLEHFEKPEETFAEILKSCKRLGIKRVVVAIPAEKGFWIDKTGTHKNFIEEDFFENPFIENSGYGIVSSKYFPINMKKFGGYFTHTELVVVLHEKS